MAGIGLVGAATANSPRQTLEELLAEAAARDAAEFKRQGEIKARELDERRVRVSESGDQLARDKFGNEIKTQQTAQEKKAAILATLPSWLKPAAELRDAFGMTVDPVDIAMSPEAQHTQAVQDDTDKAKAAAAARADAEAQQLKNSIIVKGAPSYDDLHPKPAPGPKPVVIPSNVRMKMADMNTILKMVDDAEAYGEENKWGGVGGMLQGSGGSFFAKNFGIGSPKNEELRNKIGNIKGTIAKLRGGTAFTPNEQAMLESYTPTINDDPKVIKSKISGLRQFLKFQDEAIKEQFGGETASTSSPTRIYYDANGNPIKR